MGHVQEVLAFDDGGQLPPLDDGGHAPHVDEVVADAGGGEAQGAGVGSRGAEDGGRCAGGLPFGTCRLCLRELHSSSKTSVSRSLKSLGCCGRYPYMGCWYAGP